MQEIDHTSDNHERKKVIESIGNPFQNGSR